MQRRHFTAAVISSALLPMARAQEWPSRPIKVLQGFPAGGNADAIARLVSGEMGKKLGQTFVVEAVTGAGGTLASAAVSRAAPDGYTMLLATGGHAVAGALYNKLPYETVTGFQMVSTISTFPFLLVTKGDSRFRSLKDLLAEAKSAPGRINYGTAGVGSTHHLVGELLAKMAGVQLLHIPYRGDAMSVPALLGGDVPLVILPPTAALGHLRAGTMRALAVTGAQRWSGMPDIPTVAEQGVPGFEVTSWAGWMLPAGTPQPIVDKLHAETQAALQMPAVKARLAELGGEARGSTPQEMAAMVAAEVKKWTQLVDDAKIQRL